MKESHYPSTNQMLSRAMQEVISQRELFWLPQETKLRRLSPKWRKAIERGEEILREAQKRKIESCFSFTAI
jgi:hypothetical protein